MGTVISGKNVNGFSMVDLIKALPEISQERQRGSGDCFQGGIQTEDESDRLMSVKISSDSLPFGQIVSDIFSGIPLEQ